jgi:putative nucleotidyltransferase with HDIG domain
MATRACESTGVFRRIVAARMGRTDWHDGCSARTLEPRDRRSPVSALPIPLDDDELDVARPLLVDAPFPEICARIQRVGTESYSLWEHSLAVSMTSLRIARAMRVGFELSALAFVGGLLHDLGKSKTRLETLFKVGPLTPVEMAHIREHPSDGADLLSGLCPEPIVAAVRHHHELFDGTGYPDGLAGEKIPLLARIVGTADYFEALREDRVYRAGRSRRDALQKVARAAETERLDPTIVAALLDVV